MPKINDIVKYGTQGICVIEDIRLMKFTAAEGECEYYILKPLYQENAHIYVPKDNPKSVERMRSLLSPEEIDDIIISVKNRQMDWINDRKQRTEEWQGILNKGDERELLMMISCLYIESKSRPRGLSSIDTQILKKAENMIEQEFAFSLKISRKNVGEYIRGKLEIA